jgi:hypothetical protein
MILVATCTGKTELYTEPYELGKRVNVPQAIYTVWECLFFIYALFLIIFF